MTACLFTIHPSSVHPAPAAVIGILSSPISCGKDMKSLYSAKLPVWILKHCLKFLTTMQQCTQFTLLTCFSHFPKIPGGWRIMWRSSLIWWSSGMECTIIFFDKYFHKYSLTFYSQHSSCSLITCSIQAKYTGLERHESELIMTEFSFLAGFGLYL